MGNKKVMTLSLLLAVCVSGLAATLKELKVENLRAPLGIDTGMPHFSWQLESDVRGCVQTAYQIVVCDASGAEVWNTGSVTGTEQFGVEYAGSPLASHSAYTWTLRVQTTDGVAEASSSFETAFLDASQWTGKWIGEGVGETLSKYEITFDTPVRARYLRLNVTALGLRASTDAGYSFVQLDEVEVYVGDENVALSATVTASNTWSLPQYGWDISFVNDGKIKDVSRNGWTTQQNPSTPVTLDLDLKEEMDVDRIVLYPRQNDHAVGDATKAANFPASFSILRKLQTGSYAVKYLANNIDAPTFPTAGRHVPVFAKKFSVHGDVKRARIYASALGVFTMKLNGQRVTDAVLEPGESEYEKTILYSTYDVTNLLQEGANTLLAEVAGGIYNIDYLTGRFSKGEVTNNGTTALIAELLIDYADGTSERIVTDDTWRSKSGPTLGSNWWGGEDYDARLQIPGIGSAGLDLSQWGAVSIVTPHFQSPHSGVSGHGVLRSRMYEPLRVVEEWKAVSVKTISSGGYTLRMIDFGRNFAGQYRFRLKGTPGQKISLRCGESLNPDGSIYMENFYTGPANTYEEYTFRGDEEGEEWGPEFMYHGFRYLQIIGLDEEPSPADFTAMRIRSDMDAAGTFTTSNALVNDIHVICRDAIASQLYNSITDCPHREKLGWLDVPNEMFNSLNANFDMHNFYKKVVLDCFDAQQADGHVPSVAPYYMNVYGDDTNWGGAAILVPYRMWKFYGDKGLMEEYYPQMKLLMSHYTDNTTGYLIRNSFSVLSDWGQETAGVSPMVPTEFTETTTYYYLAVVMAEMAAELGYTSDVTAYSELAANIKQAFNNRFYDSATGVYTSVSGGGGRQSEQAMPLYYGLVPDGDEAKVAAVLAARVAADGYKVKSGEIALKPIFMSLARYGYNNVVWKMANQTDCPSYGYWVVQGYTTTPEYWDVGAYSQNHCMMDHIEEWFFSELAGIRTQDNSSIFNVSTGTLHIQPYLPDDLNSLDVTQQIPAGQVRVAWQRLTDGYRFRLSVPAGTKATVILPAIEGKVLKENGEEISAGRDGIVSVTYGMADTQVILGSGDYDLTLGEGSAVTAADGETFWLPVHGVDELTTGSAIRLQTSGAGRYIGSSGTNTVSSGKFLTGADASGVSTLSVTDSRTATVDGAETTLLTLQEANSLLYVDHGSADNRLLGWNTTNNYRFGFSFSGSDAAVFRNNGGTVSSGTYLYFFDSGANSGIFATGTAEQAETWNVFKKGNVMTEVNERLSAATNGTDRMHLTRTFAQGWNTICLPFDVTADDVTAAVGEGAEVAAFTGTTTEDMVTTVNFDVVNTGISANTPYLIYVPLAMQEKPAAFSGTVTTDASSLSVSPTGSLLTFIGSYEDTYDAIAPGDYILTANSTFRQAGGNNRLRPFRAYMKNNTGDVNASRLVLTVNGSPTGIGTIDNIPFETGAVYDLGGRLVNCKFPNQIYITNGKKYINH